MFTSRPPTPLCRLLPFHPSLTWPGQVCVLGLHLAKELCDVDEDGDSWLQVTRRLPILPTLFTALEVSLRLKQNLHFTEASLHLLLTLARTQQVGRAGQGRAGVGSAPHRCLTGSCWSCSLGCHSCGRSRHHPEHLSATPQRVPAQQ